MKRSDQRNQFYSDIIVTAAEGGCYYWADFKEYNRPDMTGHFQCCDAPADMGHMFGCPEKSEKINHNNAANVSVKVRDMGDPDEPWTLIDNDAIGRALSMLKDGKVQTSRGQKFWAEVYRTMEGADIDADDADVIVQVACYGEIVFG